MKTEVIFDIETQRWFDEVGEDNHKALGVSIVSVYSRKVEEKEIEGRTIPSEVDGKMLSFWEKELSSMWQIFQSADRIIGFNTVGFDVPVLEPYTNFPLKKLPHLDILSKVKEAFGRRISLDVIAKETLGRGKTEEGSIATELWAKGDKKSLERLKAYCEADVAITKDIYDFVLKNGYLSFKDKWNTPRKLELDFGYPKDDVRERQIGLFRS